MSSPTKSPEDKLMFIFMGGTRDDSSLTGRSNPSQVLVDTSGMMEAVREMELALSDKVSVQMPLERYWSILTRMMSLSPESRAVVMVPVREDSGDATISYCVGVLLMVSCVSSWGFTVTSSSWEMAVFEVSLEGEVAEVALVCDDELDEAEFSFLTAKKPARKAKTAVTVIKKMRLATLFG